MTPSIPASLSLAVGTFCVCMASQPALAEFDAGTPPEMPALHARVPPYPASPDDPTADIVQSTLTAVTLPNGPRISREARLESPPPTTPPQTAQPSSDLFVPTELSGGYTDSSSSVTVLSHDAIQSSGAVNLRDLLNQLTSNAGAPDAVDMGISGRSGVDSVAGFNLRGMGRGATLVLLNGRRLVMSAAPVREGTDINAIPLAVVERVEIVRGGTSAIYGSNALAGVINIITRKDFEGVHVESKLGGTTGLDYGLGQASVTMGSVSELGSVQFGAGYTRNAALSNTSREFTKTIQQTSLFGNPGTRLVWDFAKKQIRALPGAGCGTPSAPNSFKLYGPGEGNAELRARQMRQSGLTDAQITQEWTRARAANDYLGDVCRYNFNPYFDLITPIERFNAFGSAVYEIGDSTSMFAEVVTSHTASSPRASPSFPANDLGNLTGGQGGTGPETNNLPFVWLGRPPAGNNAVHNRQSQDSFRVMVGLRGELGASKQDFMHSNWQWELTGTVSSSRYASSYRDAITARVEQALKVDCEANSMEDDFPCLNIVNAPTKKNQQELNRKLYGEQRSDNNTTLNILDAKLTGELLRLPAGPVDLAIIVEGRREAREAQVDPMSLDRGFAFLLGTDAQDDQRYVAAGSLELNVPIVPGMSSQLATRVDYYSKPHEFVSPKAGLLVNLGKILESPSPALNRLHLRGTLARGFVAPSLLSMTDGSRALPSGQRYQGQPVMLPNVVSGNPGLDMERATTLSIGLDFQWRNLFFIELNYYLSDYRDAVVPDDPRSTLETCDEIKEANVRDTCEDKLKNTDPESLDPNQPGTDPIVSFSKDINLVGKPDSAPEIPGRPTEVHSRYRNGARYRTSGVDFHIEGRVPIAGGGMARRGQFGAPVAYLSARGTFLLGYRLSELRYNFNRTSEVIVLSNKKLGNVAGKRNFANSAPALPRLRLRVPVGLRGLGHDVRLVASYLSGIQNDERVDQSSNGTLERGETGRDFPARVTFDFGYSYKTHSSLGKTTTLRIDVINIGNLLPPKRDTNGGTDLSLYDPRGRMVQLSLSQDL